MKQLRVFLISMFLLATVAPLAAQIGFAYQDASLDLGDFKKKKKKDSTPLKDKLWYGGGLTLGFSGGSGYSLFAFGVSPMVGYKIVGPLSVGPRVSVLYTSQKYPGIKSFNLFDVEVSAFLRCRVFKGLFLQGEIGTISDQYIYQDASYNLGKGSRTRPAQYVGLGYNFSNGEGGMGQEIAIMYDFYVAGDVNSYEQPWQYRLAFTYGF